MYVSDVDAVVSASFLLPTWLLFIHKLGSYATTGGVTV